MAFSKTAAFDFLQRAHKRQRLAHAYLITGPHGSGKRELAMQLAALVNAASLDAKERTPDPDVHVAEPESKSRRIVIEQIRDLEKELRMSSTRGRKKVGIIFEADRLQIQASNALLKTLEEPPNHSLLLLTTSMPEVLPETILSRCICVPLDPGARRAASPLESELLEALRRFHAQDARGIAPAYGLIREFARLLASAREEIETENDAELKREETLYKQATDGKWLDDREEHYKALTESRYIEQRGRLVETLLEWWADVLRYQSGFERLDHPSFAKDTARLASRFTAVQALKKIAVCEELRENLNRNAQEQLAIEVAFLKLSAG